MSQADAATALGTISLSGYTLPLPYSLGRVQAVHEVKSNLGSKENKRWGHVHFIRTKQIVAINIPSPVKLQASLKISVCFLMYLY